MVYFERRSGRPYRKSLLEKAEADLEKDKRVNFLQNQLGSVYKNVLCHSLSEVRPGQEINLRINWIGINPDQDKDRIRFQSWQEAGSAAAESEVPSSNRNYEFVSKPSLKSETRSLRKPD